MTEQKFKVGDEVEIRIIRRATIDGWVPNDEGLVRVVDHMEAYSLDIFPDSLTIDKDSSVESVSAHMGRHMCRCFLRYIEEAKIELSEPTPAAKSADGEG